MGNGLGSIAQYVLDSTKRIHPYTERALGRTAVYTSPFMGLLVYLAKDWKAGVVATIIQFGIGKVLEYHAKIRNRNYTRGQ